MIGSARRRAVAGVLVSILVFAVRTSAAPAPIHARVIWTRGEQVYVGSPDSLALEKGSLLTFTSHHKPLASGEVTVVVDPGLAIARITAGSLAKEKKLERIEVLAERPALRALPMLRIAFPQAGRPNPLFVCGQDVLRPPSADMGYRWLPSDGIWVRDPARGEAQLWPDSVAVRFFGDAADEEIALERGEVDAAVFWPGELSSYLRERPRGKDCLTGTKRHGVLAAIQLGQVAPGESSVGAAADSLAFARLDRTVFRGDLVRWEEAMGVPPAHPTAAPEEPAPHIEFDLLLPGRAEMLRALGEPDPPAPRARILRAFYLDASIRDADSLALAVADYLRRGAFPTALRQRADSLAAEIGRASAAGDLLAAGRLRDRLRDDLGVSLVFTVACPVVSAPELRPYLRALGPDAIVNMLDCLPRERRP